MDRSSVANGRAIGVLSTRYGDFERLALVDGADLDLSEVGESLHFEYPRHTDSNALPSEIVGR